MFLSLHVHHGAEKMVSFSCLFIYILRVCDRQTDRRGQRKKGKREREQIRFSRCFCLTKSSFHEIA